jgi:hypothetical protein
MECDYCHRNEGELRNIFSSFLDYIDKKINLSKEEVDEISKKMDGIYGFSLWTSDKLSKMDKILLKMPLNLVFGDSYSYFEREHPALKYIKKYYYDKVQKKLQKFSQLNELLELYSQEPSKELIELEINKQTDPYIKIMKDIEENSTTFYKVDDPKKISFELFGFNQETAKEIHDNFKIKDKNIILCPYCAYLFTGGGNVKLERISSELNDNTQQQSQYKSKKIYDPKVFCEYFGVTWPAPDMILLKENHRKMLKEYHPDNVNSLGIELRNLAEEKTKEINTNYDRLMQSLNGGD